MKRFSHYFKNSYGIDKLSKYSLYLAAPFLIFKTTWVLGVACIVYSLFRMASKNKYKRYQELQVFETILYNLRGKTYRVKNRLNSFKDYKIFKCPNCTQKLRVPRKKGNITITCQKCKTEFKGRT